MFLFDSESIGPSNTVVGLITVESIVAELFCYFVHGSSWEVIVMSMSVCECLSVCLSTRMSPEPQCIVQHSIWDPYKNG